VKIDVDGVLLHVERRGRGTPVLVLHGFTGSMQTMQGVADALAGEHTVLAVDLLGHGRSQSPADPDRYALRPTCADLVRVLEAQGEASAHVLGYSLGGRVALGLAALHPERVRSVVVIGAQPGLADPAARAERVRADAERARALEEEGLAAFVDTWMAQPLFASQRRRLGEAFWAAARRQRLANDPRGLAASLRGIGAGAQPPLHAELARTPVPALLAVGAADAKFRAIAEDTARRMARAEVAVIPDAGHACHLENPPAFLAAARRFLRARDAEPARWLATPHHPNRERSASP